MNTIPRANVVTVALLFLVCVALGLTGIVRLRGRAAQTQCRGNLRVIGVSVIHYHEDRRCYPPGTMPWRGLPPEDRYSWLAALLPYIESPPWDRTPFQPPWDTGEEGTCEVPLFLCPSHPGRSLYRKTFGLTHYVGIAGVGPDAATLTAGDARAGFFGYDRQITSKDIRHGLAETLVAVEVASAPGPWAAGGPATVRGLDPTGSPYVGRSGQFGSWHHECATHAVFADGSVRPFGPGVAPQAFEALATLGGGDE
jgi:hypothetical protein